MTYDGRDEVLHRIISAERALKRLKDQVQRGSPPPDGLRRTLLGLTIMVDLYAATVAEDD